MSEYAIGDIHGCHDSLRALMDRIGFSPDRDRLWFVGDIINRGPKSLESLRLVRDLGANALVTLGNHDMHFLAVALGGHEPRPKDTLQAILEAPDRNDLIDWLLQQNFAIPDEGRGLLMVHAGIPHLWTAQEAVAYSRELETVIQSNEASRYFREMYGNQPERWDSALEGMDRWRVITNYFTRMRFLAEDGTLDLVTKEGAGAAPEGFAPWFQYPRPDATELIFGHWAALEGRTDTPGVYGLDTGCVYNGQLTAMNLDTREMNRVEPCD
ncbi:MAG: symmetrical bis(5'-nucleosyl)-tetraphosphatase [Pseudomonadota bacterium]